MKKILIALLLLPSLIFAQSKQIATSRSEIKTQVSTDIILSDGLTGTLVWPADSSKYLNFQGLKGDEYTITYVIKKKVAPLPPATISSMEPRSGPSGTVVKITGVNLSGAVVRLNGLPVSATSTATTVSFVANTTGPVTVIVGAAVLSPGSFTMTAPPIGIPVTIQAESFVPSLSTNVNAQGTNMVPGAGGGTAGYTQTATGYTSISINYSLQPNEAPPLVVSIKVGTATFGPFTLPGTAGWGDYKESIRFSINGTGPISIVSNRGWNANSFTLYK